MHKFNSAIYAALLFGLLHCNSFAQQYCEYGIYGSGCNPNDNIHAVSIAGTTLHTSGNYCTNQGALNVTIFPDTGSATCTLVQGQSYQLNVQSNASRALAFWLDFNHNGIFDSNEYQLISSASIPNATTSKTFTLQSYPYFGKTRLRIMSAYTNAGITATDACTGFFTGEIEDYTIFLAPSATCVNPINGGSSYSSMGNLVCYGAETILSLQGNTIAGGVSYQWESSADSINWTILPGGSCYNDTLPIFASAYYRCAQKCSGTTSYSVPVFVDLKPYYNCYCSSGPSVPLAFNTYSHIGNVKISNLNNGKDSVLFNRPLATGAYSDYTSISPANLVQGNSYPMRIVVVNNAPNGFYTCLVTAFIDYNHNGIFDEPYEKIVSDASVGGKFKFTFPVEVPYTAFTGVTRMRVIVYDEDYYKNGACFPYYSGETEDYFVNIQAGNSCTMPVIAGTTVSSNGPLVCSGATSIFSLSGGSTGNGQSYEWQFSLDSVNWFSIPNASNSIFHDSLYNSYYYRCKVSCGASYDYSLPYKIELLPTSQCYCSAIGAYSRYYDSDIGKFSFGNFTNGVDTLPVLGNSTAKTVYSNFINLPIPHFNRGSSYTARIKEITSKFSFDSASARLFIDYNHDGVFNFQNESVFLGKTGNAGIGSSVGQSVLIPNTALTGVTGLRAMIQDGSGFNTSCGGFYTGEVEDYLIYIDFAATAGIENEKLEISLFPNPASAMVMLNFSNSSLCKTTFVVRDLIGREIAQYTLSGEKSSFELSVENLQSGIYFVYVMQENSLLAQQKLTVIH